MGRVRVVQVVVISVCVVALAVVGFRYFWVRDRRQHQEQTVARLTQQTSTALELLHRVEAAGSTADQSNVTVTAERDRVRAVAATLHEDLSRTRANTTAAQIGAYMSGAQANQLKACLTGVSQALNQLAVGDDHALLSLAAVDQPCRAAGIP